MTGPKTTSRLPNLIPAKSAADAGDTESTFAKESPLGFEDVRSVTFAVSSLLSTRCVSAVCFSFGLGLIKVLPKGGCAIIRP